MTSLSVIRGANMATDPDMNIYMGTLPSSLHSLPVVSFQSGSVSNSSMIFPTDCSGGVSCGTGMSMAGSPGVMSNASTMTQPGSCSSNLLLDSMQGLKNDTGLATDWSYDEQIILETGLLNHVDEPNMMKYIKIAALLREKTVRDVALRCRWMTKKENGKRRKQEEYYAGKKMKDRKEKLVDSSFFAGIPPSQPANFATYPYTMPYIDHTRFATEVPVIDGATQCRIEENNLLFQRIEDNLETFKLQDNINLLCHSRNNIASILSSMREMPGIMSQMPPLSVEINEKLADALLPRMNQLKQRHNDEEMTRQQSRLAIGFPSVKSTSLQVPEKLRLFFPRPSSSEIKM